MMSRAAPLLTLAPLGLLLGLLLLPAHAHPLDLMSPELLGRDQVLEALHSRSKPLIRPDITMQLMQRYQRLAEAPEGASSQPEVASFEPFIEAGQVEAAKCASYLADTTQLVNQMILDHQEVFPNLVHYLYDCRRRQKLLCDP